MSKKDHWMSTYCGVVHIEYKSIDIWYVLLLYGYQVLVGVFNINPHFQFPDCYTFLK